MAKITGWKDVDRKLSRLEGPAVRRILVRVFRQALKPWLALTRAAAPKKSGKLARLLRIKPGRSRNGRVSVYIALAGKRARKPRQSPSHKGAAAPTQPQPDKFYGSFVEVGTKEVRGRGFMKSKFLAMRGSVLGSIRDLFWPEIEKEMKR